MSELQKKNVIVHIGLHKTGTSTFQTVMHSASDLPMIYPKTGRDIVWAAAHHDFALDHLTPELYAALNDEILASEHDLAVISCEDLSRIDCLAKLVRLTDSLQQHFEVFLCCVLRPHDAYFESLYAEEVKRGRTTALPWDFLTENIQLLHYQNRIETIEKATGCVVRLEQYTSGIKARDYVEMVTGIASEIEDTYTYNQSLPPMLTAAIRAINAKYHYDFENQHVAQLYKVFEKKWPADMQHNMKRFNCFLTPSQHKALFDRTAEENFNLGRKFLQKNEFWWDVASGRGRQPVPFEGAAEMILDLLLLENLSAHWRA